MPYNKTAWVNDQYNTPADTYTIEDIGGGQFRIRRAGNRTVQGTPLNAANLNNAETQYDAAKADLDAHKVAATLDHPDNSVTDAKVGTRTPNQATAAAGGAQTLGTLLSMIANRIKAITGTANWYDAPATTLAAASTHAGATAANTHGSATAATANTLAHRDANGDLTVRRLISGLATGTSPLSVTSTTVNTNLNADMVDGQHVTGTIAQILSGGAKVQTGTCTSGIAFTFASAFAATPIIIASVVNTSSYYAIIYAASATGAEIRAHTGSGQLINWIAIGT